MLAVPADIRDQRVGGHRRLIEEGKKFTCVVESSFREFV
jgi:hypothetical protein